MKTQSTYICQLCGAEFLDATEALNCQQQCKRIIFGNSSWYQLNPPKFSPGEVVGVIGRDIAFAVTEVRRHRSEFATQWVYTNQGVPFCQSQLKLLMSAQQYNERCQQLQKLLPQQQHIVYSPGYQRAEDGAIVPYINIRVYQKDRINQQKYTPVQEQL